MSENNNAVNPEEPSGFDSQDCEIVIIDGPGDTAVRPPLPHLLPFLVAERERLLRWQKPTGQSQPPGQGEKP
jgi:hypothetical protein